MRIRFWGTRGSLPRPGPATVRYGGNTLCVEARAADGTLIVLDCGTGAHDLGRALLGSADSPIRGHLLISHTHWDHIQGLPFFAPLFVSGNAWDVYAPQGLGQRLEDTLAGQMEYAYFPLTLGQLGATIRYHALVEGSFDIGAVRVTARYLNHPGLTLAATRRLSAADLSTRTGLTDGGGELSHLARAFDQMAGSLEQAQARRLREEEVRRKNYELEQQNRAIAEANRLKSEFVSMVSHELRTPLTSIQGYVELLLDDKSVGVTGERRESLSIVRNNANRLLGLINDLLDLSRIEAKRQHLQLDLDDPLPAVWADGDRVTQVLANLISNAHKYTPDEGHITVTARRDDGFLRVDVRDTGMGLSPEEQAQLFTRFFRARQRTSEQAGGTGLGRVITRRLVELHAGQITVASAPGQGSTFSFSLPVRDGPSLHHATSP